MGALDKALVAGLVDGVVAVMWAAAGPLVVGVVDGVVVVCVVKAEFVFGAAA
jgi:hypothetical protein